MMLNIKELAAKGSAVPLKGTFDPAELLREPVENAVLGQVEAELTAISQKGITEVEGTLKLPYEMPCSRCLTPVRETLLIPFREVFAQRPEIIPKEELEDVNLTTEDHIKLEPYVEEAVWLALPYAPLCSESCEGLCPACGKNRNEGACGCNTDKIDPRLAGLADFFKS